jgi:hypothetical protein
MTDAKVDENKGVVALAVTDDASADTKPLLVDPVTGRLEISVNAVVALTSVSPAIKIDENREGVSMAVTDDANLTPKPLKVTATDGELILDLAVE